MITYAKKNTSCRICGKTIKAKEMIDVTAGQDGHVKCAAKFKEVPNGDSKKSTQS